MGCVSSKGSSNRISCYSCLPCYTPSLPSHCPANINDDTESRHIVSLTSSSYGVLSMDRPPCQGSFLGFHRKTNRYRAISSRVDVDNPFVFPQGLDVKHMMACMAIKPVTEVNEQGLLLMSDRVGGQDMETINTWELMAGLEEGYRVPSQSEHYDSKIANMPTLSEFFEGSDDLPGEIGSPSWKKSPTQGDTVKEVSPLHVIGCSSAEKEDSRNNLFIEPHDESTSGLKLLLSPVQSPPYFSPSVTKRAGLHAVSLSFDGNTEYSTKILTKGSYIGSPRVRKRRYSWQPSINSSKKSDMPLFDPSLLATFEQAVQSASMAHHNDWLQHSVDGNSTTNSSSSDNTWASSETASDAESIPLWSKQEKHSSASMISSVDEENMKHLASYEALCPPRGDGKVVFYHTSMRGVRKTYEDCCTLRLILKGIGVQVEERDVWMHSKFKEELVEILGDVVKGGVPLVPRLFIKGKYIGGAEEVKQLHEEGSLAGLMDGIAMDMLQSMCDGCGDVRFIPCSKCNGSRKVRSQRNEVSQCLLCNENGLIMCPICTT